MCSDDLPLYLMYLGINQNHTLRYLSHSEFENRRGVKSQRMKIGSFLDTKYISTCRLTTVTLLSSADYGLPGGTETTLILSLETKDPLLVRLLEHYPLEQ